MNFKISFSINKKRKTLYAKKNMKNVNYLTLSFKTKTLQNEFIKKHNHNVQKK